MFSSREGGQPLLACGYKQAQGKGSGLAWGCSAVLGRNTAFAHLVGLSIHICLPGLRGCVVINLLFPPAVYDSGHHLDVRASSWGWM